ncbi:hypothetical protein PG988_011903 [Apiospora saccharicola]
MVKWPSAPEYLPTRDVPIVTEDMRLYLKILDEGNLSDLTFALDDISKSREKMAEGIRKHERRCLQKLHAGHNMNRVVMPLIHSMPRHLIRAIVLGVTGPMRRADKGQSGLIHLNTYANDGPGCYVATMAVAGRGGRWLTGRELSELARLLEKYLDAEESYRLLQRGAKATTKQVALGKFAKKVDRVYSSNPKPMMTLYVPKEKNRGKIEGLIRTLRSLAEGAHPKRAVSQAPAYVGCTKKTIEGRTRTYFPSSGYPGRGNYGWWLVMSCMELMELPPDIIITPAVRIWEPGQLQSAEILVTLLAESLVEDRGYNIAAPGTATESMNHNYQRDALAATHYRRWLFDNLEDSRAETRSRIEMLAHLNKGCFDVCREARHAARDETDLVTEADRAVSDMVDALGEKRTLIEEGVDKWKDRAIQLHAIQTTMEEMCDMASSLQGRRPGRVDLNNAL